MGPGFSGPLRHTLCMNKSFFEPQNCAFLKRNEENKAENLSGFIQKNQFFLKRNQFFLKRNGFSLKRNQFFDFWMNEWSKRLDLILFLTFSWWKLISIMFLMDMCVPFEKILWSRSKVMIVFIEKVFRMRKFGMFSFSIWSFKSRGKNQSINQSINPFQTADCNLDPFFGKKFFHFFLLDCRVFRGRGGRRAGRPAARKRWHERRLRIHRHLAARQREQRTHQSQSQWRRWRQRATLGTHVEPQSTLALGTVRTDRGSGERHRD